MNNPIRRSPETLPQRSIAIDLGPKTIEQQERAQHRAMQKLQRKQNVESLRNRIFNNNTPDRGLKILLGTLGVISVAVAFASLRTDEPSDLPTTPVEITYADLSLEPTDGPNRAAEELTESIQLGAFPIDGKVGLEQSAAQEFAETGHFTAEPGDAGFEQFYDISQNFPD